MQHVLSYGLYYFLDKRAFHRILIVTKFNLLILFFAVFFWYISKESTDLTDSLMLYL